MSLASLWEKLSGKEADRKQTLAQRWGRVVKALADGQEPVDVNEMLVLTGRTVADLRSAVERLLARRKAAAAVAAAKSVGAEREQIDRKATSAGAAHASAVASAEAKYEAALSPLRDRLAQLDQNEKAARAGEELLKASFDSDNPELAAEAAELTARLRRLRDQRRKALSMAQGKQREAAEATQAAGAIAGSPAEAAERERVRRANATQAAASAQSLRAQADVLGPEIEEAEKRLASIEAARLEP